MRGRTQRRENFFTSGLFKTVDELTNVVQQIRRLPQGIKTTSGKVRKAWSKQLKKMTNKPSKLPEGFTEDDIKTESSVCTGETTIGFFSKTENKLMFAELVREDSDIEKFYKKYGIKRK